MSAIRNQMLKTARSLSARLAGCTDAIGSMRQQRRGVADSLVLCPRVGWKLSAMA